MKLAKKIARLQKLLTKERWMKGDFCKDDGIAVLDVADAHLGCTFDLHGGMNYLRFTDQEIAAVEKCVEPFTNGKYKDEVIGFNEDKLTTHETIQKFLEYAKAKVGDIEYLPCKTPDQFPR